MSTITSLIPFKFLDQIGDALKDVPRYGVYAIFFAGSLFVVKTVIAKLISLCKRERQYAKDVVYMFEYPTEKNWTISPNPSPYCLKLQTYLSYAKIPYECVPTLEQHKQTEKMPYIRYNGVCIPDSSFCMEYLNQQFKIDLDSHLKPEERAAALAFSRLFENSLYWCNVYSRWIEHFDLVKEYMLPIPAPIGVFIFPMILKRVRANLHGAGFGRLTAEQVHKIARNDIDAIATQLGNKKFLFGNDKPSTVDITAFGMLNMIIWSPFPSAEKDYIAKTYPQLEAYLTRCRDLFFPNGSWERAIEIAHAGGKSKLNKNQVQPKKEQ